MRKWLSSATIGAAIGAVIVIILGYTFGAGVVPLNSAEVFVFVLTTLAIIVGVFTVFGAIAMVNTWNDIEKKGMDIVSKHADRLLEKQEAALEKREAALEKFAEKRDADLEKRAAETLRNINDIGQSWHQREQRSKNALLVLSAMELTLLGVRMWYWWSHERKGQDKKD
jgi:hypothetical protein